MKDRWGRLDEDREADLGMVALDSGEAHGWDEDDWDEDDDWDDDDDDEEDEDWDEDEDEDEDEDKDEDWDEWYDEDEASSIRRGSGGPVWD